MQPTAKTDAETAEEQRQKQEQASDRRLTRILAVATVIVGFLQVIAIGFQVGIAARQNRLFKTQNSIIQAQSAIMSGQLEAANTSTTIALAHKRIGDNTLATQREIERAYISFVYTKVSIFGAPDGRGGADTTRPRQLSVDINIKNSGRTPGTFLGGYIGYCVGDKPEVPSLSRGMRLFAPAFLHPNENVDFGIDVKVSDDPESEAALKGETPLWIVGVVDYEDRFGGLHQCGFGRKLAVKTASLQFTPETAEWNYDRPMHQDNVRNYQEAKRQQKADA